uniref:Phosphodiesterase n=1 Tax=Chara braunii TaxID=69332 RepID=A0A1L7P089_CHABU|nr:adenylyl cyclase with PDE domain [Chara braunii]
MSRYNASAGSWSRMVANPLSKTSPRGGDTDEVGENPKPQRSQTSGPQDMADWSAKGGLGHLGGSGKGLGKVSGKDADDDELERAPPFESPRSHDAESRAAVIQAFLEEQNVIYDTSKSISELLEDIDSWEFDIFLVKEEDLNRVVEHVCERLGLLDTFGIDRNAFTIFVSHIQSQYQSNAYHNFRHACDVMHCTYIFLTQTELGDLLSSLEKYVAIISALCHDIDHPGYTNSFLILTNDRLAVRYNDRSVLESHHSATTFRVILDRKNATAIETFSKEEKALIRKLIVGTILATDMAQHEDVLGALQARLVDTKPFQVSVPRRTEIMQEELSRQSNVAAAKGTASGLPKSDPSLAPSVQTGTEFGERQETFYQSSATEDAILLLKMLVKCADISNIIKPFFLSKRWAALLLIEWHRQGDTEKALGVPVSKFMDRDDPSTLIAMTCGCIDFIAEPMYIAMAGLAPKLKGVVQAHLSENRYLWEHYSMRYRRGSQEAALILGEHLPDLPPSKSFPQPRPEIERIKRRPRLASAATPMGGAYHLDPRVTEEQTPMLGVFQAGGSVRLIEWSSNNLPHTDDPSHQATPDQVDDSDGGDLEVLRRAAGGLPAIAEGSEHGKGVSRKEGVSSGSGTDAKNISPLQKAIAEIFPSSKGGMASLQRPSLSKDAGTSVIASSPLPQPLRPHGPSSAHGHAATSASQNFCPSVSSTVGSLWSRCASCCRAREANEIDPDQGGGSKETWDRSMSVNSSMSTNENTERGKRGFAAELVERIRDISFRVRDIAITHLAGEVMAEMNEDEISTIYSSNTSSFTGAEKSASTAAMVSLFSPKDSNRPEGISSKHKKELDPVTAALAPVEPSRTKAAGGPLTVAPESQVVASPIQPKSWSALTSNQVRLSSQVSSQMTEENKADGKPKAKESFMDRVRQQPWAIKLEHIQNGTSWQVTMIVCTLVGLFADDINQALFPKEYDKVVRGADFFCFFLFSFDLIAACIVRKGYFLSFFFFLDAVATISLLPVITDIFMKNLSIARAGRAARAGTRASRLLRFVRMARLLQLIKIVRAIKRRGLFRRRRSDDDGDDKDQSSVIDSSKPSNVWRLLSELQTQKLIFGVLAMMIAVPLLHKDLVNLSPLASLSLLLEFPIFSEEFNSTLKIMILENREQKYDLLYIGICNIIMKEVSVSSTGVDIFSTNDNNNNNNANGGKRSLLLSAFPGDIHMALQVVTNASDAPSAMGSTTSIMGSEEKNQRRLLLDTSAHPVEYNSPEDGGAGTDKPPENTLEKRLHVQLNPGTAKADAYSWPQSIAVPDLSHGEDGDQRGEELSAALTARWAKEPMFLKNPRVRSLMNSPLPELADSDDSNVVGAGLGDRHLAGALPLDENLPASTLRSSNDDIRRLFSKQEGHDSKSPPAPSLVPARFASFVPTCEERGKFRQVYPDPMLQPEGKKNGYEDFRLLELSHFQTDGGLSEALFSMRPSNQLQAAFNVILTLFVVALLGVWSFVFARDSNRLLIQPIERMVFFIKELAEDPVSLAGKIIGEHHEQGHVMETSMVEGALMKIASLTKVALGEAGLDILSENLKGSEFNPLIPGKKIRACFGFCDIRNFTDTTECLKEEVMMFVNEIAQVVHSRVVFHQGSPNKNIGDAFLLVWKKTTHMNRGGFGGSLSAPVPKGPGMSFADRALKAFLDIIRDIETSKSLAQYSQHPSIQARMPGFKIRLGFGLHVGWAIEGAIGSRHKVDPTYLSPHVNIASRLEAATKQYGVILLISEMVIKYLTSTELKANCRKIDRVTLKGSNEPLSLYTCNTILPQKDLDGTITDYTRKFESGVEAYINGNWEEAIEYLEDCKALWPSDKPAQVLLAFMATYNNQQPDNWRGFRELTEK